MRACLSGYQRSKRNSHRRRVGYRRGICTAVGREGCQGRRRRSTGGPWGGTRRRNRRRFVSVDVTNTEQIEAAVNEACELGPLRVLVNSAGIGWAQRTIGKDGQFASALQPRRLQEGHRHQSDRHFRLHPAGRDRDEPQRADGQRRARRDRVDGQRRRLRRPDRTGRVLVVQGWRRGHDAASGA